MMKRIEQEDMHGCGLACLAMLTGQTYAEVKAGFEQRDFTKDGVICLDMENYLAEHGYAVAVKYPHYSPRRKNRDVWPPEPFTDAHFVHVDGKHYVVMLRDGTVLDPAAGRETPRHLSDYSRVDHMVGVVRMEGK